MIKLIMIVLISLLTPQYVYGNHDEIINPVELRELPENQITIELQDKIGTVLSEHGYNLNTSRVDFGTFRIIEILKSKGNQELIVRGNVTTGNNIDTVQITFKKDEDNHIEVIRFDIPERDFEPQKID